MLKQQSSINDRANTTNTDNTAATNGALVSMVLLKQVQCPVNRS